MYYHAESVNTIKDEDTNKNIENKNENAFTQTRRLKRIEVDDDVLSKALYSI